MTAAAMDELCSNTLSLLALAAVLLLPLLIRRAFATEDRTKLPPGPWTLPVIGSLHHLVGALPHRALLRLSRRQGPIMLLRFGEVPTVVISSAEAAKEILKVKDPVFAGRPRGMTLDIVGSDGKGLVLAPYGEHWRQMRKVCVVELLSARQVNRIGGIRQAEVARLVESVRAAASPSPATVDLGQALRELTSNVVARAAFGGECRQQQAYLRELDTAAELSKGFSLADLFPSWPVLRHLSSTGRDLRRSINRILQIIGGIIDERREKRGAFADGRASVDDDEDLLDVLLRLQEEDSLPFPLTTEIIGAVIFDMFGAGTDTTAITLEWAMAELLRNPQTMARATLEARQKVGQEGAAVAGADLPYLRMVIKETLRVHPAATVVMRASQEDCLVMGYHIPKNTNVYVNVFAVAMDPAHWSCPEEFRPERFEDSSPEYNWTQSEFIPFGAGRRQCPGALFATTTIELALASLLYHFDWSLPDGETPETMDMAEVFGITVHRRSSLCAKAALHVPR